MERGWYAGSEAFRQELLAQMKVRGGEHYGTEIRESAEAKAEEIVREKLQQRKWTELSLDERRKGDPGKVKIAQRLRSETTMTLSWIAQRLRIGSKTHPSHLLYWDGKRES